LVVNNGSTDDTVDMLRKLQVPYITQENVGSAGGWHRAIQHALDHGFDAVWLMDDDGYPAPEALERLAGALVPGIACASSVVLQEERPTHFVFPVAVLNDAGYPTVFAWPRKIRTLAALRQRAPAGRYPIAYLFNGALLSMAAVRQVGNVNRDFFIYAEEVDYFFRLRRVGQVISVLDAVHYHPAVDHRQYNPLKVYYYVKNALILNRLHYDHVWLRQVAILGVILYRIGRRNGLGFLLSLFAGRQSRVFYAAVVRGLQGRIGKDFNG
jgi:GT2 family glycosyltransferase